MVIHKRYTRILAVVAGASMLAFIGPVAAADDSVAQSSGLVMDRGGNGGQGHGRGRGGDRDGSRDKDRDRDRVDWVDGVPPSPDPSASPNPSPNPEDCVVVVRAEQVLETGEVIPAKTKISHLCRSEEREERRAERDAIREAGGTWGAVQRQDALIRVAEKLAERHAQVPTSSALATILLLINKGLPEAYQIDIDAFLAQYELAFADLIKPGDDEEDEDDEDDEVEPSPSPSVSPEPSPVVEVESI